MAHRPMPAIDGDYREVFTDFCELELETGGPDHHIDMLVHGIGGDRGLTDKDLVWRAGCYIAPYVVATGAAIWSHWDAEGVLARPHEFRVWIRDNWSGLKLRRERRAVRSPAKLAKCLETYAWWVTDSANPILRDSEPCPYDEAWVSVDTGVMYFGRYATIKLLETIRRMTGGVSPLPDIRPGGAWSPRLTLSVLYPQHAALLVDGGSSRDTLHAINEIADTELYRLGMALGRPVSMFQLEVLLCNLRQAIERKYPGRPLDTELGYFHDVATYWGQDVLFGAIDFFGARGRLFPEHCLGELQGWSGPRDELGLTYRDHNYFWSDTRYDYHASQNDLARPVWQA